MIKMLRTTHFEKLIVVTAMHQFWKLLHDYCNTSPSTLEVVTIDATSPVVIRLLQHLLMIDASSWSWSSGVLDFVLMISNEQLENWGFSRLFWLCFYWMYLTLNSRAFVMKGGFFNGERKITLIVHEHFGNWIKEWIEFLWWIVAYFVEQIQWEGKGPPSSPIPLYF